MIRQIKDGVFNGSRSFNDRTRVSEEAILEAMSIHLVDSVTGQPSQGGLTVAQKASMRLNNSTEQLKAYAWMHSYFHLVGDHQPNSNEEIHLDPVDKYDIYTEYYKEMLPKGEINRSTPSPNILGYSSFLMLWDKCFP